MAVFGAIVDEAEQRRRRQALDEAVEQHRRLDVDPVQKILEDQQDEALPRLLQGAVRVTRPDRSLTAITS